MLYAALNVVVRMNIRKGLSKTYSPLIMEIGGKYVLIYAIDVVMQLMFGFGIRVAYNVKNMKCTGLKAVSYPDTQHLIKGSTVKFGTDTRIFYIVCYRQFLLRLWMN